MDTTPWIGIGLEGTLSIQSPWCRDKVGPPVKPMLEKVLELRKAGRRVKIFTARVSSVLSVEQRVVNRQQIREWCLKHLGEELEITAEKDPYLEEFYDDRALQVEFNVGVILTPQTTKAWR